jgi:hypothetical protein
VTEIAAGSTTEIKDGIRWVSLYRIEECRVILADIVVPCTGCNSFRYRFPATGAGSACWSIRAVVVNTGGRFATLGNDGAELMSDPLAGPATGRPSKSVAWLWDPSAS